jgi:uncharacterized membrane protein
VPLFRRVHRLRARVGRYLSSAAGKLVVALGLIGTDGRPTAEGLLGWVLVLSAVLALPSVCRDIFGAGAAPWNSLTVIGGLLIWLSAAWRLARAKTRMWPAALLAAAVPFAPLLALWPAKTSSLWLSERDARLFIFSLVLSLVLGLLAYRIWPKSLHPVTGKWSGLVVVAAATAYVAIFGLKSLVMYSSFHTGGSTPAGFDQALWNGAHWFGSGEPLTHFLSASLCCDSILSDHAFLIFIPLLPVYAVGLGGPEFLMITQCAATALAAVALYLLARGRLGNVPAALLGLAYLAFFVNQRTSAGDFRTDAFVAPLLLFALYAFTRQRVGLYYGLVILALACKEEVALVVIALGLYLILFERSPLNGAATIALAAVWFALDAMVIMPYAGGLVTRFYAYYRDFGSTPIDMVSTLLFQPAQLALRLSDPGRVKYLVSLLVPLGFAPLLGPSALLIALPRLALNLLSGWDGHYSLVFWYEFSVTPFLFVAAVYGLERLGKWGGQRRVAVVGAGAVYILSGCLLSAQFWGPHPLREISKLEITDHHRLAQMVFDLIPPDASVAAQSNLSAHLAHRKQLSILPEVHDADYILFDVFNPNRGPQPDTYEETLRRVFDNPDYGLIFYRNGYLLFQRGADYDQNLPALALVSDPHIQYPMRVMLNDSVAFLGFDLSQEVATPGEQVYLTTYWQSLKPAPNPYLVFTAYPGSWSFTDAVHGLFPVAEWPPGEVIKDERAIVLPVLPDGEGYEVALGLWYDQSGPELESPDQLLGCDVIRIVTFDAESGRYSFGVDVDSTRTLKMSCP